MRLVTVKYLTPVYPEIDTPAQAIQRARDIALL